MQNKSGNGLGDWKDIKIFKDPVHQYIEIPKIYIKYLIDTFDMQRIKDVAQSGLKPVYIAATHNRFSHSLGVYHLGKKAFQSLKNNLLNIVKREGSSAGSEEQQVLYGILNSHLEEKLELWEVLFHIACILHDIGHPAMSHTLEYLYDDIYVEACQTSCSSQNVMATVSPDEYNRYCKKHNEFTHADSNKIPTEFQKNLGKKLLGIDYAELKGNPHERMSAYYILSGVTISENQPEFASGPLAQNIIQIIESFYESNSIDASKVKKDYLDFLRFICRMIIGETYDVSVGNTEEKVLNSIKNAIINLLNGKIDVDSLDYISRNSYSAGYDTNKVDVNRLCNAFSVRFQKDKFIPVFEKNALSVLEGFVSARNFEPGWLYSHHKIVYNIDVLYKSLYKYAAEILYEYDLEDWSRILLERFYDEQKGLDSDNKFYDIIKKIKVSTENSHYTADTEEPRMIHSFDKEAVRRITERLNRIYVSTSILDDLLRIKVEPLLDEVTHNNAMIIYNVLCGGEDPQSDLMEQLKPLLSASPQLHNLESKIAEYIKDRKDFTNMLAVILNKRTADILETPLKPLIQQTRIYLSRLADESSIVSGVAEEEIKNIQEDFLVFIKALTDRYSELVDIKSLYFSYILSPLRGFMNKSFIFYRSNDSDIDALFKNLYYRVKGKGGKKISKEEQIYMNLAQEYFERRYKTSLWKSYQEYKVFIDGIAEDIRVEPSFVNKCFLDLIESGGKIIRLHNDGMDKIDSKFKEQRIFSSYDDDERKSLTGNSNNLEFQDMFAGFSRGDFVIKIHEMRYKNFSDTINIAFKDKIFPLGEVIELTDASNKRFPYIFYKMPDDDPTVNKGKDRMEYMDEIGVKLKRYCRKRYASNHITLKEAADHSMENSKGKVFRDVVHGDIIVPKNFMYLIETQAFQRLRRIKQLSTADLVFTNAAHTRFAHCIGTFHVMTLIVEHFQDLFKSLGVSYKKDEVDALLAAALLHDIGHGPYSHNFEHLAGNTKKHEKWSTEIIGNDLEIRNALKSGFPENDTDEFIKNIISYIDDEHAEDRKQLSFHTIFKSLISSQLDADRIDYLLRDSFNTGMSFGNVDVNSIIRGMQVTEYKNQFYVCITESAVSYIEQFLFGRYKMYDSVYYNAYKVFAETLVLRILEYVKDNADRLEDSLDENILALFNNNLSLKKYLTLDDAYINGLFSKWQNSTDPILSDMCKSLLQRRGYERLYIMNQSASDLYNFKEELKKLIDNYFPNSAIQLSSLNSFIFAERQFTAYRGIQISNTKDQKHDLNIWVLTNDGLLKDLAEVSPMFISDSANKNWDTYKSYIYYNKELLAKELDSMNKEEQSEKNKEKLLTQIDQLVKNLNLRSHIEIEEKYSCTRSELDHIQEMLEHPSEELLREYKISSPKEIDQEDIYYDTKGMQIAYSGCSFRCRKKSEGPYKITIKAPTPNGGFDKESQVARFEYEKEIRSGKLVEATDFIRTNLRDVIPNEIAILTESNIDEIFVSKLKVANKRRKYMISNAADDSGFKFSICLDRITFKHDDEEHNDYQIEVELESDYVHRVSMKFFTDKIEKALNTPVQHEKYSKYIKGLLFWNLIHLDQ